MQLNTILQITGELLREQGDSPTDAGANTDALLPFAAVLSGALSLVTPAQAATAEGNGASLEEGAVAGGTVLHGLAGAPAALSGNVFDAARPATAQPTEARPTTAQLDAAALALPAEGAQTGEAEAMDLVPESTAHAKVAAEGAVRAEVAAGASSEAPAATALQAAADALARKQDAPQALDDTSPKIDTDRPVDPVTQADGEVGGEGLEQEHEGARQEVREQGPRERVGLRREAGKQASRPATASFPSVHTTRTGRSSEPTSPAGRRIFELKPVAEALPPDASGPAAVDGLMPDAENEAATGTLEVEGRAEEKATAGRLAGQGPSADAEDRADAQDPGTSRRERGSRRAEAASEKARAMDPSAREEPPLAQHSTAEAEAAVEAMPDEADRGLPAQPESDPDGMAADALLARTDAEKAAEASASGTRGPRRAFSQSRTVSAAWLRAALSNARQTVFTEDGWKMLEMNLDGGEGTVTIKARREEGRVSVAVGFSDPDLRALASAHADRLQEVLQAEYETTVDFSLFNSNAGHSEEREQAGGTRAPAATGPAGADDEAAAVSTVRSTLPLGARHEWVG